MFLATPDPIIHALTFVDACAVLLVTAIATTITPPLPGAFVVLLVTAIATTITPPLPGAFILIPGVLIGAMIPLFGVSKEEAFAYSMLTFMLNYIPVTIVGGLFMLREQVRPTKNPVDLTSTEGEGAVELNK